MNCCDKLKLLNSRVESLYKENGSVLVYLYVRRKELKSGNFVLEFIINRMDDFRESKRVVAHRTNEEAINLKCECN